MQLTQQGSRPSGWSGPDGIIGRYIREELEKTLEAYRSQPNLIAEHANQEEDTIRGGYANRQLFELVQNSADALSESSGGTIHLRLTAKHLYCADDGNPIDTNGVRALMFSHLSSKRGTTEIGRFGMGFKSVLGVTSTPEFFSRSGSFRFDRSRAGRLLRPLASDAERYPVLRVPESVDPEPEMIADPILENLMEWAANIVRLPLELDAYESVAEQVRAFPAEFLLFVEHVRELVLMAEQGRTIRLHREDGLHILDNGTSRSAWMLTRRMHQLSSRAKSDSRSLDNADEVPIWWAAPLDRLDQPGKFWAFFPTLSHSLLAGILNAPWKTNEDRQSLLPGIYNNELIDAATYMVADALPRLSTKVDPAKHLDALPRRVEAGDSDHSIRLREKLFKVLIDRPIIPNQDGKLRGWRSLSYPPEKLISGGQGASVALDGWAQHEGRPSSWLHHRALPRTRMARLRLVTQEQHRHSSVSQWLTALVNSLRAEANPVRASMAAVQIAASIPAKIRASEDRLGDIVLTSDGRLVEPDPAVLFLGRGVVSSDVNIVHPHLEEDQETLTALEKLGIRTISPEAYFRSYAWECRSHVPGRWNQRKEPEEIDDYWREFWELTRDMNPPAAVEIIDQIASGHDKSIQELMHVRTVAGEWHSLHEVLLPGRIVPSDGSRDAEVTVDVDFHGSDLPLLESLGAVDAPRSGQDLSPLRWLTYRGDCRFEFIERDFPSTPRETMLNFDESTTSGPLDVLQKLSEEGNALYTWELLRLEDTYWPWTMRHDTQIIYPPMDFPSPAIDEIEKRGLIRVGDDFRPILDGLGGSPRDLAVRYALLSHSSSAAISQAFGLPAITTEVPPETVGEDPPVPLVDIWPGLAPHLPGQRSRFHLIRCDGITVGIREEDAIIHKDAVYITRKAGDRQELQMVLQALGTPISHDQMESILSHETPEDVQRARDRIRACSTDEERLLETVGEDALRERLPQSLVSILEDIGPLRGIRLAQAAIATFHTDALREYRHALDHLDPPQQWAGRQRAVDFVRSLGFGEEWAGDPTRKRDPFVEVPGPYSLPPLHDYQRRIVANFRNMLESSQNGGERRAMISMPTGSGKTRVAVQAIVEAIREDGLTGGILWVADRDELCEQAVEAWREVWSSEGTQATPLRISRLWAGQEAPAPTAERHVIVASVQTLSSRIERLPRQYEFLADFQMAVFDEAHRSITPTSTTVMQELGLTRWRREREPFLIGLTATPYRGYDEAETRRLVNRYSANRLDTVAFENDDPENVIQELQDMDVLARVDHATIQGGDFFLSRDEMRQARENPWLPRSVERRIALDADRTRRIVQTYREQVDPEWPALIFATSVEHAKTIAALLTYGGTKARAVSAATGASTRQRIVKDFRTGDIRVLVNYAVFREGFDAPRTRAIIVARPVYSPNLYFQMIGRGLRGVKNGGNERCLVLNVRDNIENFEGRLAFTDLDWLWA